MKNWDVVWWLDSMLPVVQIFSDLLEHFVTFHDLFTRPYRYLWTDVPLLLHIKIKMIFNKSEIISKPPHIHGNDLCNN